MLYLSRRGCLVKLCGFLNFSTRVGLGALDYRNPEQLINMAAFTPHPQYNSNTLDYDYAVITLSSTATREPNVSERFSHVDIVDTFGFCTIFTNIRHFFTGSHFALLLF